MYKAKGVDGGITPDSDSVTKNDPRKNWKATYENGSRHCTQLSKDGTKLTAKMKFYRNFLTSSSTQDIQIQAGNVAQEFKIRGYVQPYDDSFTEIGSEIVGQMLTFKPQSEQFYAQNEGFIFEESQPAVNLGKIQVATLKDEEVVVALVETTDVTEPELFMTMMNTVSEDETELTLKLVLKGFDAALSGQMVLMYAQVEDAAKPGLYESVSCTVRLDKQYLGYTMADDLWIMNYNGDRSLRVGSKGVLNKDFKSLNLSDQAGEGKPWISLMTED